MYPMQPGDVYQTYADVSKLKEQYGYKPKTSVGDGVRNFVQWHKRYYNVENTSEI